MFYIHPNRAFSKINSVKLYCDKCGSVTSVNVNCFEEIYANRLTLKKHITLTCKNCGEKHCAKSNPYICLNVMSAPKAANRSYEFSDTEILMASIDWNTWD